MSSKKKKKNHWNKLLQLQWKIHISTTNLMSPILLKIQERIIFAFLHENLMN